MSSIGGGGLEAGPRVACGTEGVGEPLQCLGENVQKSLEKYWGPYS